MGNPIEGGIPKMEGWIPILSWPSYLLWEPTPKFYLTCIDLLENFQCTLNAQDSS